MYDSLYDNLKTKCPVCLGMGLQRTAHPDKMGKYITCRHCKGTGKKESEPQRHAATTQK